VAVFGNVCSYIGQLSLFSSHPRITPLCCRPARITSTLENRLKKKRGGGGRKGERRNSMISTRRRPVIFLSSHTPGGAAGEGGGWVLRLGPPVPECGNARKKEERGREEGVKQTKSRSAD